MISEESFFINYELIEDCEPSGEGKKGKQKRKERRNLELTKLG